MKRDNYYKYIEEQLHILANRITTNGKLNMLHLHLHSENFYLHFYNLIYDTNLKNLNDISQNVEAIDLIDEKKKIMIQVSSTSTKQKIESALSKDILEEYSKYRFKFISIAKDTTDLQNKKYKNPHSIIFDPAKDIYDIRSFLNSISSLDIKKLKKVYKFIQCELGEESKNRFDSSVLKEKYLTDFKTISLLTKTEKPIDKIFINLSLIEDAKDEDIKKVISHESFLDRDDFPHDEDDFMDISELLNQSSKSLIYGTAGIGKTTLCKYISYMWAKGEFYQEFDYVIYIPLRQWKHDGIKGAIKDYYFSLDDENITFDLKDNNNKILFLFDGYDELKEEKKQDLKDELKKQELSHYIITSRPYGYEKNDFLNLKQHFETMGFTPNNVEKYIENFFENEKQEQSLKNFLDVNINIKALGYIPLMLEMICSMWEQKSFDSNMTMTELYGQVIEDILEKHSQDERVYEWENREDIKELLGKIAFEGLIKQTILFDGKLIRDNIGRDKVDFFKESIVNSGFLKSDRKDKSLLGNNFEFLHLTFQEYFSALYVSKLTEEEQWTIIAKYKFYPHFQVFFVFLAGLIQNKTLLIEEIGNEPKDLIGFYEILFIMNISSEIKGEELDKATLKNINEKLKRQIEIACRNDSSYDTIFENLKKVIHIIDDDTIEMLLDIIELEEDEYLEKNIINTFFTLIKYDEKYKKYIEQIEIESDNEFIKKYIYDKVNKVKEKREKKIEIESIIEDLKSTQYRDMHIFDTLYAIQTEKECNIKIKKIIINIFEKHNINDYQKWIIENSDEIFNNSLCFVFTENSSLMSELKLNSQDEFIDFKVRAESLKVIAIIEGNSENVIEELINYIKNGNLDEDTLFLIRLYIDEIIKYEDYSDFVSLLIKLWEDENIDDELKSIFVFYIDEYTERSNDKVTDIILTACEQNIAYALNYFTRVEKYDNEYIDRFIKLLEDEKCYENNEYILGICEKFGKIAEKNFYAHIKLIELSKKELGEKVRIEYGLFLDFYSWLVKTSVLFQDYDKEVSSYNHLFEHITYNNIVLFIENNKLCTIENGKKIYTQRDVDSKFLEELKAFLDGDKLDD